MMTDDELDAELARALNVDHAPGFGARVRERIDSEAPVRTWWHVPAAASVGLALILATWIGLGPAERIESTSAAERPPVPTPVTNEENGGELETGGSRVAAPVVVREIASRRGQASREAPSERRMDTLQLPDVIVSREEQRAFERFLALAREGAIPVEALAFDGSTVHEPLTVAPIEIAPIEIEPLPSMARLESHSGDLP